MVTANQLAEYSDFDGYTRGQPFEPTKELNSVLDWAETMIDAYQTGAPVVVRDLAVLRLGAYVLAKDFPAYLDRGSRSNVLALSGVRGMLKPYAHRRAVVI